MSLAESHVVVVGAGAVGSFYGALLAQAGHRVTLVGRTAHVQAVQAQGLRLTMAGQTHAVALQASTGLGAVASADLVLLCVKSPDTLVTAQAMASLLRPRTPVMCLQNGVENADLLAQGLGSVQALILPTVVYVAVGLNEPGHVQHHGRNELVTGLHHPHLAEQAWVQHTLQRLVADFAAAQTPLTVSDQVVEALWHKLLINCAYNAISALSQKPYGVMAAQPGIVDTQRAVVDEVLAVAAAQGLNLPREALWMACEQIATSMATQLSSTARDLARGKPSEIDHLNGFIARRGAALGVATPVNQALWALIKLAEAGLSS